MPHWTKRWISGGLAGGRTVESGLRKAAQRRRFTARTLKKLSPPARAGHRPALESAYGRGMINIECRMSKREDGENGQRSDCLMAMLRLCDLFFDNLTGLVDVHNKIPQDLPHFIVVVVDPITHFLVRYSYFDGYFLFFFIAFPFFFK
jgi:hypothetical protein